MAELLSNKVSLFKDAFDAGILAKYREKRRAAEAIESFAPLFRIRAANRISEK